MDLFCFENNMRNRFSNIVSSYAVWFFFKQTNILQTKENSILTTHLATVTAKVDRRDFSLNNFCSIIQLHTIVYHFYLHWGIVFLLTKNWWHHSNGSNTGTKCMLKANERQLAFQCLLRHFFLKKGVFSQRMGKVMDMPAARGILGVTTQ